MIVDDHPGVRKLIRQIAVSSDDAVCECSSGEEALRLASEFKPDVVTMDVRMPGLCGIEATRLLRTAYPPARVMVVTSVDQPGLRRAATDAGAWAFLSKEHLADLPALLEDQAASLNGSAAARAGTLKSTPAQRIEELEGQLRELRSAATAAVQDLRVPLRAIGNSVNFLQAQGIRHYFPNGDTQLAKIHALARTMDDRIERLHATAHSHLDPIKTARVDPRPLILEALDEVCGDGCRDRLDLSIDTLPHVQADRVLLRLVFVTLLANALKRSAKRDHQRIEIGAHLQDGETILSIRDNGIGFDLHHADRLFQPLNQIHSSGEAGGTGSGLVNVRDIVQRHGGRIWAEAEVGSGATFSFTLPAAI